MRYACVLYCRLFQAAHTHALTTHAGRIRYAFATHSLRRRYAGATHAVGALACVTVMKAMCIALYASYDCVHSLIRLRMCHSSTHALRTTHTLRIHTENTQQYAQLVGHIRRLCVCPHAMSVSAYAYIQQTYTYSSMRVSAYAYTHTLTTNTLRIHTANIQQYACVRIRIRIHTYSSMRSK